MASHKMVWGYAHNASIFFAVLLFAAGFLCVLLWTNNIVPTTASTAPISTSTFTYYSPTVQTFTLTYGVAIFGTVWNSILYATLIILGRNTLPISTPRLRYDIERAACRVAVVGNAIYSTACIALMATFARLAGDPPGPMHSMEDGASSRRAGLGVTAAMAGLAGAAAMWTCLMDALHIQHSPHRDIVEQNVITGGDEGTKQE